MKRRGIEKAFAHYSWYQIEAFPGIIYFFNIQLFTWASRYFMPDDDFDIGRIWLP